MENTAKYFYNMIPDFSNFIIAENEYAKDKSKNNLWYKISEINDKIEGFDTQSFRCLIYADKKFDIKLADDSIKTDFYDLGYYQGKRVYAVFSDEFEMNHATIKINILKNNENIDDNYLTIIYF